MTPAQSAVIAGELREAIDRRIKSGPPLEAIVGPGCTLASPVGVRLPWGRTFEAAFDLEIRC